MDAVMAVGAEKFQPELEPADMVAHLLRQGQRGVEVRGVDGEIERRCHGASVIGFRGAKAECRPPTVSASAGQAPGRRGDWRGRAYRQAGPRWSRAARSEAPTSETSSLIRHSYAVFSLTQYSNTQYLI